MPHGDRSGVVIEPYLTDQWYVNAAELAKPATKAVEDGSTVFVPKSWEKTYFEWMRNIQPWCISRQLWWGHQIPAWYGCTKGDADGIASSWQQRHPQRESLKSSSPRRSGGASASSQRLRIQERHDGRKTPTLRSSNVHDPQRLTCETGQACHLARRRRARHLVLLRLWAFSTLGWPDKTPELARFYPTSVLVTGFDIIFFWVARMMMMGLHFMKEVPFHTVYIHALVRDERGQKMSKSKGNVMDPLGLIDQYGADALTLHARGDGGAGTRHQALHAAASRATAISQPSCGTPRASPR